MEFVEKTEIEGQGVHSQTVEASKEQSAVVPRKATVVLQRDSTDDALAGVCAPCDPSAEKDKAPVDRVILPSDVAEFTSEDDVVYIIGPRDGKVTQIAGLDHMHKLEVSTSIEIFPLFNLPLTTFRCDY